MTTVQHSQFTIDVKLKEFKLFTAFVYNITAKYKEKMFFRTWMKIPTPMWNQIWNHITNWSVRHVFRHAKTGFRQIERQVIAHTQ